jgi:GT2 family glycosyltransferase
MTVPASAPLCIVPAYLRDERDADALLRCLVSLWSTQTGADVLVVDDGSPAEALLAPLGAAVAELGYALHATGRHRGFAAAANIGLEQALAHGRDAVLVHADVEFTDPRWLAALAGRTDTAGRPAAVVGARLRFPNGDLQDAGRAFSQLTRTWVHRFQHGPGDLPAALAPTRCPVGDALMLVRAGTLDAVGLLDEDLPGGGADLDYCLRVFDAGLECIYEPAATAIHHVDEQRSDAVDGRLAEKWAGVDLGPFVAAAL